MTEPRIKTPRDSAVEARHIIMPHNANHLGIAFGGTLVSWIDMAAVMAAERHSGMKVVTAGIDRLSFLAPCHSGDHIILRASVNYVGHTSMEVGVQVMKENPFTGEKVKTTNAYLTFVAFDRSERPMPLPPIEPQTPEEIRRYENAKIRVAARKQLLRVLKQGSA